MNGFRRLRDATPEELQRGLATPDGIRSVAVEVRKNILRQLSDLRHYLERVVCSEPWLRHAWTTGEPYPPDATTTPMMACECDRCSQTGRLWPAHYCQGTPRLILNRRPATVISYECYLESLSDWEAAHIPSSPSGIALRAVREGHISLRRQRTHLGRRRRIYS